MPTLFDLINDPRSKNSHLYGRPSSGKTTLGLYKADRLIQEGHNVLYLDTHGSLDHQQVQLVAPRLSKFVITWSSFDNVLEAISTHGADHIILDDLAAFSLYLADDGFRSNFSGFMKRLAEMAVSVDVINQIRSKPGVDEPVPYYEDYITSQFRNNVVVRRVEHTDQGMLYQMTNQETRLYLEVLIDNMGIMDEDYTLAALMKEPLTPDFRKVMKVDRDELMTGLITRYGFKVPQTWI